MITMLSASHGNVQGQNLRVAFVDHPSGAGSVSERFASFNATLTTAGVHAELVLVPTALLSSTKLNSQRAVLDAIAGSMQLTNHSSCPLPAGLSCAYDGIMVRSPNLRVRHAASS